MVFLARDNPVSCPSVFHLHRLLLHQDTRRISINLHHQIAGEYIAFHLEYNLNLQKDYPFPPLVVNDKFYLNRFTEQAFLNNKKQVFKSSAFDENLEDINLNEVSCKKEIQEYIDQMRQKYKYLNKFNQALILFGQRVKNVSDCSFLIKSMYSFAENEIYFKDNTFS